jgi:hypothetical protein
VEDKRTDFVVNMIMSGIMSIFQLSANAEGIPKLRSQISSQVVVPAIKLAYQLRRHVPSLLLYMPGRRYNNTDERFQNILRQFLGFEFDDLAVNKLDDPVVGGLVVVPGIIRVSVGNNGLANTSLLLKAQAVII